jgi:ArsR family transcriptional regulator
VPTCRPGDHDSPPRNGAASSPKALARAAQLLKAMGDEGRLRILEMLTEKERCVTEMVEALDEKFSTVSQRLRVLRSEGLTVRRRKGTHIFYALADRHVADLLHNALAHAGELQAGPTGK